MPYLIKKIIKVIFYILSIISFPLALILFLIKFRILKIKYIGNIGHLAIEPDTYIKDCLLNKKKMFRLILVAPTSRLCSLYPKQICCSPALAQIWRQHFFVITSPYLALIMDLISKANNFLLIDITHYAEKYDSPAKINPINTAYKGPPLLQLPKSLLKNGYEVLSKFGVPQGKKFIVFANRDSGYLNCEKHFSQRNNDINLYWMALKELVANGYYCIRIGAPNSQPLNQLKQQEMLPFVIDYTRSSFRSDWMDLFLVDQAEFFISGCSGVGGLAVLFQTPILNVSTFPFCHVLFRETDMNVFKLYYSKKESRFLTFSEILSSNIGYFIHDYELDSEQLETISPSENDILNATKEMMDAVQKCSFEKSSAQKAFNLLWTLNSYPYPPHSRTSEAFLKKYAHLFGSSLSEP